MGPPARGRGAGTHGRARGRLPVRVGGGAAAHGETGGRLVWPVPGTALRFQDPEIRGEGPPRPTGPERAAVAGRPCAWPAPGALAGGGRSARGPAHGGTGRLRNRPPPIRAAGPRPQLRRRDKRGVRSHVPRGWAPIWGLVHLDEVPAEPPAPGRLQEGPGAAPGPAPPRRPPSEHLSSPAGECRLSGLPGWQRSCRAVQATPSPRPPRLSAVRVPANPLAAPQAAPSSGPRPPHGAPYPTASQPRAAQPGRGLRAVTGSCGGTAWRLARTAVDSHRSTRRRYHGHGGSSPRPRCGRTRGPHRVSGGQRVRLLPTSLVARTTHTREHTVTGTLNG